MPEFRYSITPEEAKPEEAIDYREILYKNFDLPVIDFIRHASSNYEAQGKIQNQTMPKDGKPITHGEFMKRIRKFNSTPELLPKVAEREIREMAETLFAQIDPKIEILALISSPTPRAWQTAKIFLELIELYNLSKQSEDEKISTIQLSEGETPIHESWLIKSGGELNLLHENKNREARMANLKQLGPRRVGKAEEQNFNRFLRHLINFKKKFSEDSLEKIKGKKVRIVCFSHGELTEQFINKVFGPDYINFASGQMETPKTQENAQIYEINPYQTSSPGSTDALVRIYPTKNSASTEKEIKKINFSFEE